MKKINIITALLLAFTTATSIAQEKTGHVILDAMNDELQRNMKELRMPDFNAPFYIMYGIYDNVTQNVSATMGAITNSGTYYDKFSTNTRVLVGNYDFNDESLDDNIYSNPDVFQLPLPMDDDYIGLRRALWSSTDRIYRSAARHYQKHQQTLKESNKKLEDLPHRSFVKVAPVKIIKTNEPVNIDMKSWETRVRNLSARFNDHPSIENSFVSMNFIRGDRYITTSEGTLVKLPHSVATLTARASAKNANGEFVIKRIQRVALTPDKLPDENAFAADITQLIASVEEELNVPALEEEYSGPVLFLGEPVANLFGNALFRGNESILANDFIERQTGYQMRSQMNSLDSKIGKLLISETLTIKAKPTMKSFNGIPLLGSYEVDPEGVVPADEVVVFEKGVLKELLNNRSITHSSQKANGFADGAGVLEITSTEKFTVKQLKEKLIAAAKKQGLDFALIIQDANATGMLSVIKVNVADGTEQKIRSVNTNSDGLKIFKNLLGVTGDLQVINDSMAPYQAGAFNLGANFISYIVPTGVLVNEMDIEPLMFPSLKEEQYVSRPK